MTIAVRDENEEIVGEVEYNDNLDHWDGRNHTCGSTGRHKGLTQISDGQFVLIHGTQWQNERDTAEVITPRQAVKEIIASGNDNLFEEFPELQEIRDKFPSDKIQKSKTFSIRINKETPVTEVERKLVDLRAKIDRFLSE
jgi:hypothetical protein